MRSASAKGFTLTELSLVVAIIGLLLVILAPVYVKACECRNATGEMARRQKVVAAFKMYAADWDESLRPVMPHNKAIASALAKGSAGREVCGRVGSNQAEGGRKSGIFKSGQDRAYTALAYNPALQSFTLVPLLGTTYALQVPADEPAHDYEDTSADYSDVALETAVGVKCELSGEWPAPCRPGYSVCAYICDNGKHFYSILKTHPTRGCPDFAYPKHEAELDETAPTAPANP